MILVFKLSMPNTGSWNGRWSGDGYLYAVTRHFRSKNKAGSLIGRSFIYDFGDGWTAKVSVDVIDRKEAIKIRKKSRGFAGYDWMIDSIIKKGKIDPN